MGMRKAAVLYIIGLIVVSGAFYYSLPPEQEAFKDQNWENSKTQLKTITSRGILDTYEVDNDTKGVLYDSNTIRPSPQKVTSEKRYREIIDSFREGAVEDSPRVDAYFDELGEHQLETNTSYLVAFVTEKNVLETVEERKKIAGGTKPIVTDSKERRVEFKVLMVKDPGGNWELGAIARRVEEESGEWRIPPRVLDSLVEG